MVKCFNVSSALSFLRKQVRVTARILLSWIINRQWDDSEDEKKEHLLYVPRTRATEHEHEIQFATKYIIT